MPKSAPARLRCESVASNCSEDLSQPSLSPATFQVVDSSVMRRSRETVHRHRKGAGPERDDAQPDADRKWSIENEPEEKEIAQLQARLKREADEPPESSTYPRHNSVRSDYHESYVEDRQRFKPMKPGENMSDSEWLERSKSLLKTTSL